MKYKNIKWTHQIKLPNGETTSGEWAPLFDAYGLTEINFKKKRVLDIGCLDGVYSFYAEERGSKEVLSIDINDINEGQFRKEFNPNKASNTGYLFAHNARKSKAKYIFPYSVYDLDVKKIGTFDIVLFLGVIYHLAHPVLALEKINEVMNKKGILVLESQTSESFTKFFQKKRFYMNRKKENDQTNIVSGEMAKSAFLYFKYFLSRPLSKKIKLVLIFFTSKFRSLTWRLVKPVFFKNQDVFKNDKSNFWIIDPETLRRMIDFAGFKIEKEIHNPLADRTTFICRKESGIDETYSYRTKQIGKIISNFKGYKLNL